VSESALQKASARPATVQSSLPQVSSRIAVGIDTGGTFTDLIALVDGALRVHKVPSTPDDPARAVLKGLREMLPDAWPGLVIYSSTVATNALLERKGARVAILTNAGFEDLIEIGRQNRDELYALAPSRPEPLVPRLRRIGVRERTLHDGTSLTKLSRREIARVANLARRSGADSFAVCLLHSYANPRAEEGLARALAALRRPLSVSHRLLSEYREYERFSTAVVNAYVAPKMASHLENLRRHLRGARLRIMQSNGSATGVELARAEPIRTILSGPAAGVVGAAALARAIGTDRFITFDMGGTSTDVSLFDAKARLRTLSYPDGYAVRAPVIDIHTVGAGGGSIARVDAGGSLRVGPESAGADPGPACYGRGSAPAVTDADLIAGRLVAGNFLGGRMRLYPDRAHTALHTIAAAMKTSLTSAARGVIRVVNANMERAIRVITVERGFDPRDFVLLGFGGAGPMHAAELALDLGIRHVVFPRNPGLLCAWGAIGAPLGREYSMTVREVDPPYTRLVQRARPLIARARYELAGEGAPRSAFAVEVRLDMRYRGQSYELEVPLTRNFTAAFHAAHRRTFGHSAAEAAVEVVNLRLRASAADKPPSLVKIPRQRGSAAPLARAQVLVGRRQRRAPVFARDSLGAGARIHGPAIVVELSATAYVAPGFTLRVDDYGNLHLEAGR